MSRASIWDGSQWVSMTGGSGEEGGGGEPDDTYLRLDGANNNSPPSNYIRQTDGDGRYLQLTGGTLSGALTLTGGITNGAVINSYKSTDVYGFQTRNTIITTSKPSDGTGMDGDVALVY